MLIAPELLAELNRVNRPDEEIDFSGMPEVTELRNPVRGRFYRPVKEPISLRLDADLLQWLRAQDVPYQTLINQVLRRFMEANLR